MIRYDVKMTTEVFKKFAFFNDWRRQHRYITVSGFALLMCIFASINFYTGMDLLGYIILLSGIGLPMLYVLRYNGSIKKQVIKFGLNTEQPVYKVDLKKEGVSIAIVNGSKSDFVWGDFFKIYRTNESIYLYVRKDLAYILPDSQAESGSAEEAWRLIKTNAADEKLQDRSRRRL